MLENIVINRKDNLPLYKQLKNALLNMIWDDKLTPGTILPTEVEFSKALNISVSTVRQCMNELEFEGYVEKRRNRGTIVLDKKINLGYSTGISDFNEKIKSLGMVPNTKVLRLSITEPSEKVRNELKLKANEKVIELFRLREINNIPTVYIESFIPYEKNKYLLMADFEKESLYALFSKHPENKMSYVKRRVFADNANDKITDLFGLNKNTPYLSVETHVYNNDDKLMEYSISFSPKDRNEYVFTVNSL